MAKKVELPDNLRYLYTKDAASGAQAGFNVQAVRDRLTEIQYDLDHIQGDIDQIINGDLSNIYQDITDIKNRLDALRQEFNQFKIEIKNEIDNRFDEITKYIEAKFQEIAKQLENLGNELDEVKRTYEHFPTGTQMLFYQKSAPPGWSIVTGLDDSIIRVNGLKGGELVNGASFTQVFKNTSTAASTINITGSVGATYLTIDQIPGHSHTRGTQNITGTIPEGTEEDTWHPEIGDGKPVGVSPTGAFYSIPVLVPGPGASNFSYGVGLDASRTWQGRSSIEGGGQSHTHSLNITGNQTTHTHTLDLTIKNISVIVCKKEIVF